MLRSLNAEFQRNTINEIKRNIFKENYIQKKNFEDMKKSENIEIRNQ